MNLISDMWILLTRNITMAALLIVLGMALVHWSLLPFLVFPLWFHMSGGLITNGDLLLRNTRVGKCIWIYTAVLFSFLIGYALLKVFVLGDSEAAKQPDVFDYRDVLMFLFGAIAGVFYIVLSAWAAAPSLSYTECVNSMIESMHKDGGFKPALLIGLLYPMADFDNCEWLYSVSILASSAWVMRYMLGTPPERKTRTSLRTAEGAA